MRIEAITQTFRHILHYSCFAVNLMKYFSTAILYIKAVNYFQKKPNLRCSIGFLIHLWFIMICELNMRQQLLAYSDSRQIVDMSWWLKKKQFFYLIGKNSVMFEYIFKYLRWKRLIFLKYCLKPQVANRNNFDSRRLSKEIKLLEFDRRQFW